MVKKYKISNLIFLLPAILWMAFITYMSSRKELPDIQQLFLNADKLAHFFVYLVLGIFLYFGISINIRINQFFSIILTFIIGSTFSIIDEYHQSFVPNRVPDFLDFIADVLGILFSLFFYKQINLFINLIFKKINFKK